MPSITIETTAEEQAAVLRALSTIGEVATPVRKIAEEAGLTQSRARYALVDLIEAGKVERVALKAFNKHYVRYSYKIL